MATIYEVLPQIANPANVSAGKRLAILLWLLFTTMVSVELISHLLQDRRQVSRKIVAGVQDALGVRGQSATTPVLFAGNSLVFEGTDSVALQQSMGNDFAVHVSGIPGSTYYDWQYGLSSLFARGSRPRVVVFAISPSQMLRGPATTALPVAELWTLPAIAAYSRDYKISLSDASNMALEHFSTFFAFHDTLRIYVRKWIPGYETLANESLGAIPMRFAVTNSRQADLYARLATLKQVCSSHGATLVFLIVPTRKLEDASLEPTVKTVAAQLHVPVIAPVGEREWPLQDFREDGYHLTPRAAIDFSRLAGSQLARALRDR